MAETDEERTWIIACLFGAGVEFTGTRQDAEEHVNKLAGFLQLKLKDSGISFLRKQHTIVRKGFDLTGGNAEENGAGILQPTDESN
jgi:hypothetical protein